MWHLIVMSFLPHNITVVLSSGWPHWDPTALKHFKVDLHLRYFVCHCTTARLTRIVQTLTVTSVSCLICVITWVNIIKKTFFAEQHGNSCFCYRKLTIWTHLSFISQEKVEGANVEKPATMSASSSWIASGFVLMTIPFTPATYPPSLCMFTWCFIGQCPALEPRLWKI